ncbi:helix-turn-helix domain-containing protein [Nonomuraea sp. NPDC049655]|uniref:helix-turn-helix domain-containing protein n=1 Tax=Nonomuraea sp. NPDC049655 TaxID=3364355 RepID=UPI00379B2566
MEAPVRLRDLMKMLGSTFVHRSGHQAVLTDEAQRWLQDVQPAGLVKLLHRRVRLIGELLFMLQDGSLSHEALRTIANERYAMGWTSLDPLRRRTNWLQDTGCVDKFDGVVHLMPFGRSLLADLTLGEPDPFDDGYAEIDRPTGIIGGLLDGLQTARHQNRADARGLFLPSPTDKGPVRFIADVVTAVIPSLAEEDLDHLIRQDGGIADASAQQARNSLRSLGLITRTRLDQWTATEVARAWLESNDPVDLAVIIHANTWFVGEILAELSVGARTAPELVTRSAGYGRDGLTIASVRVRLGLLRDLGFVEKLSQQEYQLTAQGRGLLQFLPLAGKRVGAQESLPLSEPSVQTEADAPPRPKAEDTLPVTFRFPRLAAVFGSSPECVSYEQLNALTVNDAAGEAEDLDYKLKYETGDKGSDDIAVDIATFANHRGGVIVVGMAEVNARPSKVVGVELSDEFERWIRSKAAERIFPMPQFALRPVANPADSSKKPKGLMLIIIPPSSSSPHAVVVPNEKGKLRWPRRHGTSKMWLSESEIAAAYRRRFVAAADQGSRLIDIETDAIKGMQRLYEETRSNPGALLVVSLVPETLGDLIIDADTFRRFQQEVQEQIVVIGDTQPGDLSRATVGRRRLICWGGWSVARAELHSDGSGTFAVQVPAGERSDGQAHIWDSAIVMWIASALRYLGRHARHRANASGVAATTTALLPYMPVGNGSNELGGQAVILTARHFGNSSRVYGAEPQTRAAGQADFLLDDLANDGQPLAAATAQLASDLFQAFGAVETLQIGRDGTLRRNAWTGLDWPRIERWAVASDIPIDPP